MSGRRMLGAMLVLAALIGFLGFLYNRTQAINIDGQNRLMLDLRELGKLDAEWDVNILRSHIGINNNYDPITTPLVQMRQLQARLPQALPLTRGSAPVPALERLGAALDAKIELVEQFKSQNAILRNSLLFFPPAVIEFSAALKNHELDHPPQAGAVAALDNDLHQLLAGTLRYNLAPEQELADTIAAIVRRMAQRSLQFPVAMQETAQELARHANAILLHRPQEDALEEAIAAIETSEAIDAVGSAFDKEFDAVVLEKQRYRGYLSAYSALLLLLLMVAAWRLRRSYAIIADVARRLRAANETLERRVAERTAELEAQSAQLARLAQHDSLTGLINYGQLSRMLEHALVRAGRRNTNVVVMFIDLDGFKTVNDTWGHATGDLVLKEVAARVQPNLRKEDALARLGGDEFVILLEEVSCRDGAVRVAQLALDAIESITEAGGHPVRISASIGIASAAGREGAARGAGAVLSDADQAMYHAKQLGKARYGFSPAAQWCGETPDVAGATAALDDSPLR